MKVDKNTVAMIENLLANMNGLSEQFSNLDRTNIVKIDEIKIKTSVDLILVADEISRDSLGLTGKKNVNGNDCMIGVLTGIAKFISNEEEMKALSGRPYEDIIEIQNKTNDRNKIIYEILFEEKLEDFNTMKTLTARRAKKDMEMKIVEQLTILIVEACIMSYEALLDNAKKIVG
jgi:hypothetical protein